MRKETFMMIKPDAMNQHVESEIKDILNDHGFVIEQQRNLMVDEKVIKTLICHYEEVIQRVNFDFKARLVRTFFHQEICLMRVSYDGDIIHDSRELVGATEPIQAKETTIRSLYSKDSYEQASKEDRLIHNCIHASDSLENAERELKLWKDYF